MSGLTNLKTRNGHHGGPVQQDRMIADKLRALKSAYLYSYQAAVAILADNRKFRCLMNPHKLDEDNDFKVISIPFEDNCLNSISKEIERIDVKPGDIFTWEQTNTNWIIAWRRIEELAYFRGECYRLNAIVELNGQQPCFVKSTQGLTDEWHKMHSAMWNSLNYDAVMVIPKTESNLENFKRGAKIKINGDSWYISGKNTFLDGILEIGLSEANNNSIEDAVKDLPAPEEPVPEEGEAFIDGPATVKPYEKIVYTLCNLNTDAAWTVNDSKKAVILAAQGNQVCVGVISGKSGKFVLAIDGIEKEITIQSI